ncbi:hypothetical protein L484_000693 [Morus notabilis]|uniref:Uncharacterized protein n=1 Tax=Morus notabilis TaxID=981085 RepID=W9QNJ4_9ROSA|nr:hypothetical protein L484_000693 [Morus notabilis]
MADSRDALGGDTPLHVTAALGDEHMVKLLLQKGANKDIRNYARQTPYDVAAENGHSRLFDVLRLGDSLCLAARKGEVHRKLRKPGNMLLKFQLLGLLNLAAFGDYKDCIVKEI